jgi:predicted metal-dependent phosphotriesterase family hydrolase
MKKDIRETEDMSSRNKSQIIVGIGYYKREEWERFLASAEDREELEDTYDEWVVDFHKTISNAKKAGVRLKKVTINLDDLMDYCIKKKRKNNSETRSHFIADLVRSGRAEEIN